MTEERMSMAASAAEANAMYLAEHVARYAVLRPHVQGLRVLDIACGEGYGSWLLKEWGAASVVAADISREAVEEAQRQFGREGVRYLVADACSLSGVLDSGGFDLIASFETIEHVSDPAQFLRGLKELAAPGARIFISCPNDHVALPPEKSNPYHLQKYTFEEFQAATVEVLGPAAAWLLGANVQGYGLVPAFVAHDQAKNVADLIKGTSVYHVQMLPSQLNIRPDRTNVLYYMGIWGESPDVLPVVVSPQSYEAFVEPWQALEWFKEERVRMQGAHDELRAELDRARRDAIAADSLAKEVERVRRENIALNNMLVRLGSDLRGKAIESNHEKLMEVRRQTDALNIMISRQEEQIRNQIDLTAAAEHRLNEILQSRSWNYTRGLRVLARLARGEFESVRESFRAWRRPR